jgi:FtsZ-interacting cell division protein ZipA
MSDLQLGLILIGAVLVVAVYAFNRWQERQLRRRVNAAPVATRIDPVQDASATSADRVEPKLSRLSPTADIHTENGAARATQSSEDASPVLAAAVSSPERARHTAIDYACSIHADAPIAYERLLEFLKSATAIGKRVALQGWTGDTAEWVNLPLAQPRPILRASASLQLADRAGPVNRVQLATMRDLVQQLAHEIGAVCECPQIDSAEQAAVELDKFCAEVDISIGCHVVPKAGVGLSGTKVRGLLEARGYVLESDGRFWLYADDGAALLSAADSGGTPLSAERLRTEALAGVTLTLDVPNAPAVVRLFDRMLETAGHLADALDAAVVDDNRKPLTDAGLDLIREQVRAIHVTMAARGILAGSPVAARLFS